jgi:hypothetical protein
MGVVAIVSSQRRTFRRIFFFGMNSERICLVVFCVVFLTSVANWVHAQMDITEKVRRNTVLDRTIRDFCSEYCQGNGREGRLISATVQPIGKGRYRAAMTAELLNRQEAGEPFNVTIFDWSVRVRAEGVLDSSTCVATVDSLIVDNDVYGILSGVLDGQKGRKYQIPNCQRLLPSAEPVPRRLHGR